MRLVCFALFINLLFVVSVCSKAKHSTENSSVTEIENGKEIANKRSKRQTYSFGNNGFEGEFEFEFEFDQSASNEGSSGNSGNSGNSGGGFNGNNGGSYGNSGSKKKCCKKKKCGCCRKKCGCRGK